jgi:magnesium transporter
MPLIPRIRRGPRGPKLPAVVQQRDPRIEAVSAGSLRWLNIDQPSAVDLDALAKQFDFHELDYEDVLSRRQRPKVDEYPEYLFVVLHFPFYDKAAGRLNTAELDAFLGPDFLVTLPNVPLRSLSRVFHRCEGEDAFREEVLGKGSGYLFYRVISELFDYCFPILDKIGHKLDEIEDAIFEGRAKEMVRQISNAKQEIIAYRKIIKPELTTLRVLELKANKLARLSSGEDAESLEVYFDDVIDAGERIWDILENYKEIIEALEDTSETVIQHRLNDILLALTIISATVLPVTLVASVYGMNLGHLPFAGTEYDFWIVMGMMLAVFLAFVGYFRYKRWF